MVGSMRYRAAILLLAALAGACSGRNKPSEKPPAAAHEFMLHGFRSAHFGMTEGEVRAAIAKDFNLSDDAVRREANEAERTEVLTIGVPNLIAGGGTAEVAYYLGYKSKHLIQVGVTWSKATDAAITPERLEENARHLASLFAGMGYRPQSIVTNQPAPGGTIVFRGSDAKGHTTILLLRLAEADKKPEELDLYYAEDLEHPDIYQGGGRSS
jgi:hypothetical protein